MYYLWEMYFSGGGAEMTWPWFRVAGGLLHPTVSFRREEAQGRWGAAGHFEEVPLEAVMHSRPKHFRWKRV